MIPAGKHDESRGLASALLLPARCQPGVASDIRHGIQPGELPAQAGIAQGNQKLVITQPSNETDQDRRLDCASCPADYLPIG